MLESLKPILQACSPYDPLFVLSSLARLSKSLVITISIVSKFFILLFDRDMDFEQRRLLSSLLYPLNILLFKSSSQPTVSARPHIDSIRHTETL